MTKFAIYILLIIILTAIFHLVDFLNQYLFKNDTIFKFVKLILTLIIVVIISYTRVVWGISKNEYLIAVIFCGLTYLLFEFISKYFIK